MFIGVYSLSVFFSYIAVFLNIISCVLAINDNMILSITLFMLSGFIDMFDGRFADLFKRNEFQKKFGEQIDTVLDVVNFAIIPIILLYLYGFNDYVTLLFYMFYIFASTMRLAYFNTVIEKNGKTRLYQGFPTTTIALYLPFMLIVANLFNSIDIWIIRIMLLLISMLYILNIKIIKPKSILFPISVVTIGLIILCCILVIF